MLADVHSWMGDTTAATTILDEGLNISSRSGEVWCDAELFRKKGELSLNDRASAETQFRRALDIAKAGSQKLWELRAATSLAGLWFEQGKRAEAQELLSPVYAWFTEGLDAPDLRAARTLLGKLGG
jgi:predicted ATPase